MKKIFTRFGLITFVIVALANISNASMVSDAGMASATEDSVCANVTTTLILAGYTGSIQWQSFDGSNWINETNPGSTTDNYTVAILTSTDFRAVVTDLGFPPDTSNIVTVTVGAPPVTTGDSRCGYGPVTLTATGGGSTFKWFNVPTGGTPLYRGSSFTTNVSSTTTFYAASMNSGGGSDTIPLPPQYVTSSLSSRGYFFTAPSDFTITGLFVPEPLNGSTQSIAVIRFNSAVPPPITPAITNDFVTLFLTQNNPSTGVIPVNIPVFEGDIIGVLGTRGTADANSYGGIYPYSSTINGQQVNLYRMGTQSRLSLYLPQDVRHEVNNPIGRIEITYEVACESGRTPAVATVTSAPSISTTANPPALCQGGSTTLNVSSANPGYTYTWSPPTDLSGTTGTTVTATPVSTITYTVLATDGPCGAIDSILIPSGPASVAGTSSISTDTICSGISAYLSLAGNTGNIQWQSYNGSAWVNETGPGNTTNIYEVNPISNSIYHAVVTSGGCDSDTTNAFNVEMVNIVDPSTVNDTICAPGTVNLVAAGPGQLNWYNTPTGGSIINTGTSYAPNISTTSTYYVQAYAGGTYQVGPTSLSFGSQQTSAQNGNGLQFDVNQSCTLERVWVSPGVSSGNITIKLTDVSGVVLNSVTAPVTAFSGLVPVALGFQVNPGTYRLVIASGSVLLYFNSNGATFPYTSIGCPITITGFLNPVYGQSVLYYFFYNWEVSLGCASNRIPVVGVLNSPPAIPSVVQNGTILTSSAPSNNQWNLNGVPIPGATSSTFDMGLSGSGSFTVTVTIDGCASTSIPVIYTGLNENMSAAGIAVYPNPVKDVLSVNFEKSIADNTVLSIYNSVGALMLSTEIVNKKSDIGFNFPSGIYSVEIKTTDGLYVTKVVKL